MPDERIARARGSLLRRIARRFMSFTCPPHAFAVEELRVYRRRDGALLRTIPLRDEP